MNKHQVEPIILAVALGLLALGAAGLSYFFPSISDITGVSSTVAEGKRPAPLKPEDVQASLQPWLSPSIWKVPEDNHRLFISDGFLFYASLYPDGKYIQKNDGSARTPGGVLLSWYQKYGLDFTDPNIDREDNDGDGFSNITEFKNETANAADCDGTKSTNPLDSQSHPTYFSRLRLQKYESRPFHIQFLSYQLLNGEYEFQIALKDVASYSQPRLKKTGDPLGFENYVVGKFTQKTVEEEDAATHTKNQVDESTLELTKPDIGFTIVLTYRKEMDSPESTADFIMLMPGETEKVIKVARGKTFSVPEMPQTAYTLIDVKADGATIRDGSTKADLHVPQLVPAELDEVPIPASAGAPKSP